jgi:uncharacterized protein (DUF1697 family)
VPRYAALLRAVNVGGRKVGMQELRALFEELGHGDVRTYVQSGNVVFTTPARSSAKLAAGLEKALAARFGIEIAVVLRAGRELQAVIDGNPFLARGAAPSHLYVTLLRDAPTAKAVRELTTPDAGKDEYEVVGRDVFLHYPGGYGRSKLTNAFFERRLGVVATTRNWRTITNLAALATA